MNIFCFQKNKEEGENDRREGEEVAKRKKDVHQVKVKLQAFDLQGATDNTISPMYFAVDQNVALADLKVSINNACSQAGFLVVPTIHMLTKPKPTKGMSSFQDEYSLLDSYWDVFQRTMAAGGFSELYLGFQTQNEGESSSSNKRPPKSLTNKGEISVKKGNKVGGVMCVVVCVVSAVSSVFCLWCVVLRCC